MENFQSIAIKMVRSSLPLLSFFEENHTASINPYPHMYRERSSFSRYIGHTSSAESLLCQGYAYCTEKEEQREGGRVF